MTAIGWRRRGDRPWVLGHRGNMAGTLENTLAAFERARAVGADGVELDVRPCRTGELLVFHDADLCRLAGRGERLDALAFEDAREIRLDDGSFIPELEEVIETLGPGMRINFELKAADRASLQRLAELIRRHDLTGRALVSSFDPVLLARARRPLANIPIGYLFHAKQPRVLRRGLPAHLLGAAAVHPEHVLLTRLNVQAWKRRGYLVNTWTVDGAARVRQVSALGVDTIISNDPAATLAALAAG